MAATGDRARHSNRDSTRCSIGCALARRDGAPCASPTGGHFRSTRCSRGARHPTSFGLRRRRRNGGWRSPSPGATGLDAPLLRARDGDAAPLPLPLDGPELGAALRAWLDAQPPAPLRLIEAPPLQRSLDAVLLAGACDGLLLVAETGVTTRAALRAAAERAREGGCVTVGVVLTGRDT
ncbi:hypothetical protein KF840_10085 [bacterium]|nr:hypothetical protein [bacterium]